MRIRLKSWELARELSKKRLSRNAWARRLGISSSHLSMLAKGRRPYPSAATRRKLLKGLDLPFHELFQVERRGLIERRPSRQGPSSSGSKFGSEASQGGWAMALNFRQDLRYALRMLIKRPAFSALAVFTLALGIGINSAIYSLVDAVLLRPLPYRDPASLVIIWETNPALGVRRAGTSGPTFLDWKERNRSFEDLALIEAGSGTLMGLEEPEQVPGMRVTVNLFDFLGVEASLGRAFLPQEGRGGRHNSVILSHGYWQRRYAADPGVLGQSAIGDGLTYTVVGVLPGDFWLAVPSEVFVPWDYDELREMSRSNRQFGVLGRLRPGVSLEAAQADLNQISSQAAEGFPQPMRGWQTSVLPLKRALFEHIRPALLALLAAVGFVLLIACANVANLLLARTATRCSELSIRAAMGAGRWRLVRQLITEGLLLGALGGLCGLLTGIWCHDFLRGLLPDRIPVPDGAAEVLLPASGLDFRVLAFTAAATLLTSLLFAALPAFQASRPDLLEALSRGGRTARAGSQPRMRNLLIVAEVALSLVLLVGAALMVQNFVGLLRQSPGTRSDHLLTLQIELPTDSRYQQGEEQSAFFEQVLDRVRGLPGVKSAGMAECIPLSPEVVERIFRIPGRPDDEAQDYLAYYRRISQGYFQAMGIPLIQGRAFDSRDQSESQGVAVIDQTLAQRFWPGQDPVGQMLIIRDGLESPRRIVGVAGAVRQAGLDTEPRPTLYVPHLQRPFMRMTLAVHGSGDPSLLVQPIKQAVWSIDPDQPVYRVQTIEQILEGALATQRVTLWLMGAFALVAVALAAVGIYGVTSFSVAQRSHEIGVRMALGARPFQVLRMVAGQGMVPVLAGVGLGWVLALAFGRVLSGLLYRLDPQDPATLAGVSVLLAAVALLAAVLPARRASRVDPLVALHLE